ncbi:hypothetical protein [Epilithonimonas hungarica]|uniref:Uncharacterized protein n=1 Tax=Epilithonimonas hungarica TaxID=454006 RepID=A0A1G7TP07_9FLAO|nr:hypothetical protein [Epilithonimonas hungarica]SDG36754.1 hypothetical protein SAMN05421825_3171 [Epilithonimonas hungarica]
MKLKILLASALLGIFVMIIFSLDFFLKEHEVHIVDKYSVLQINGEYNLMRNEDNGYGLIVPSVMSVYTKQKEIVTVSNFDGSKFINSNYKSKYFNVENKYYYYVKQHGVQEISEEEFLKLKETYNLIWDANR